MATIGTLTATKYAMPVPITVREFIAAAQTVPAGTLVYNLNVRGMRRIFIQLTAAAAALTGFSIGVFANNGGTASTLYSVTTDYTSPKGILIGASGDLTTLNATTGWFILDVTGLDTVVLTATSAGTATLALAGGGS